MTGLAPVDLTAHAYAHLFALPDTGLRYGLWGRPDMAMWLFTEAILQGRPIKLFNNGQMQPGDVPQTVPTWQTSSARWGSGPRLRSKTMFATSSIGSAGTMTLNAGSKRRLELIDRRCHHGLSQCPAPLKHKPKCERLWRLPRPSLPRRAAG